MYEFPYVMERFRGVVRSSSPLNAPCHKCEKRSPGCHAACDDYKAYRAIVDDYNKEERKRSDTDYVTIEAVKKISKKDRTRKSAGGWKS